MTSLAPPESKSFCLLSCSCSRSSTASSTGVYYLLIALGLSLIFSLGGVVNRAHGVSRSKAYLTLVLSPYIGSAVRWRCAGARRRFQDHHRAHAFRRFVYRSDPISFRSC